MSVIRIVQPEACRRRDGIAESPNKCSEARREGTGYFKSAVRQRRESSCGAICCCSLHGKVSSRYLKRRSRRIPLIDRQGSQISRASGARKGFVECYGTVQLRFRKVIIITLSI